MKLFERTGGYWMFYISAVYLIASLWSFIVGVPAVWLAPMYCLFLAMPFWFPPLGRAINLRVDWDQKMFDFFRSKTAKDYLDEAKDNVYNLPKPKAVPPMPEVKKEEPAKIFYRFGMTDNNRVAFSMGYTEITMNREGCQNLIDEITFYMNRLEDESDGPDDDPDGGEPVPVPERKAA